MNYTKTSVLFAATFSLLIAPAMIEDAFAAERIPGFMKTNIEWYATGQISEDEFINALTYLMNKDIIVLDQARADAIKELRDQNESLRKQMAQYRESDLDFAQRMQEQTPGTQMGAPFVPGGAVVSSAVSGMKNTANIHDQIASTTQELASLYDTLEQITEEIKQHQANAPDTWDDSDDPTRFNQARDAWQDKMNQLLGQLSEIQSKIDKLIQKLEQLQGELPAAQQKDQVELNKMMAQQHEEMTQQMDAASHQLGSEVIQKKHIATRTAVVSIPDENGVEVPLLVSIPDDIDVNAFVQSVLRESYLEQTKDLQFYADKVRYYNDMKTAIRDQISDMREKQSEYTDSETAMKGSSGSGGDITIQGGSGSGTGDAADYDRLTMKADLDDHQLKISEIIGLQEELDKIDRQISSLTKRIDLSLVEQKTIKKDIALLEDASIKGVFPTKVVLSDGVVVLDSKRDLDAYKKSLEEELSSAGDDAQLANIDLQNALQKQQQTLQTMSNVSKMLHDTAMAIIRKIG